MPAVAHNVLTMTPKAASGDAINPQTEKPIKDGLGTLIVGRFTGIGLSEPLPELHQVICQHAPPVDLITDDDARKPQ